MTLYFDTKIEFLDSDAVSTISSWHPNEPLFAVASYSQERGGSVTIFADTVSGHKWKKALPLVGDYISSSFFLG